MQPPLQSCHFGHFNAFSAADMSHIVLACCGFFLRFAMDPKLTEVLNLIDAGETNPEFYDMARHIWINHLKETMGAEELQVSGTHWDLFGDPSVHSAASPLFQMKIKNVCGECLASGEQCPHHSACQDEPGNLASLSFSISHLEISPERHGMSLQRCFNAEFNSFNRLNRHGKLKSTERCGDGIVLNGRVQGCDGKRMVRTEIVEPPEILAMQMNYTPETAITQASQFELQLSICGEDYLFAGAILTNRGHFRSLMHHAGKFLMYDGMWGIEKLKWFLP